MAANFTFLTSYFNVLNAINVINLNINWNINSLALDVLYDLKQSHIHTQIENYSVTKLLASFS